MPEQPSYRSSTTSQLLLASVCAYLVGALILAFRGQGIEPIKWLIELLLPLYGLRSGIAAMKNGGANGQAPPVVSGSP